MQFLRKFFATIHTFFRALIGSFHWTPPSWVGKTKNKFFQIKLVQKASAKAAANPQKTKRIFLIATASIAIFAVGGYALKRYLDSLPKPAYATVTIQAPHAKKIDEKKVTPLVIEFSESVAPIKELNKPLLQGPDLSPAIAGIWHWSSDHTLVFTPKEEAEGDWIIGEEYSVKIGKDIIAGHVKLEEYKYKFTTEEFTAALSKPEFYIDPRDPKIKKVTARVDFNYPVKTEDLKKKIHFTIQDKDSFKLNSSGSSIPSHVTFNKTFEVAYLESDVLPVPEHSQILAIRMEEEVKPLHAKGNPSKGEKSGQAEVPGRYDGFSVSDFAVIYPRNEKYEPEQVLKIDSSLAADSEDVNKNLKILLLPEDHQPTGARQVIKKYNWNSPQELTPEVLAKSEKIDFTMIPTENPVSNVHSFRVKIPTHRSILVTVNKNTKAWGDYLLKNDVLQVVRVPPYPRELNFMGDGAVLSLGGDKQLPLLSRNLSEVHFEISRVIPEQVNHVLLRMLNSSFKQPSMYEDLEYAVSEHWDFKQKLELNSSTATQYFALNLEPYIHKGETRHGLFLIKASAEGVAMVNRLVLLTDLGAIAKTTNSGKTEVFAQNFRTGLPLADATVEIVGKNGISVLDARTGPTGQVTFPDLKDYRNEKLPTAIVIKKGGDISYLPYRAYDREINYSRFDTGGIVESSASDQLLAMLFSDRGIYRPGETASLGMIVRAKNWKKGKAKIPVTFTVQDPRGNEVKREKLEINSSDLKSLSFSTQPTSPTGTYTAQLFVIQKNMPDQQIGSTTVQVQEFVPDHLRINAALSKEKAAGWIAPEMMEGNVSLHNMFGSPAEDRRIEGRITLTPVAPVVKGFNDFIFANPNKHDAQTFSENLPTGKTDDKGHGKFDLDLAKYEGFFYLRFEAQGFEAEAGKGVSAATGTYVSNLPYLVGYKPESELSYIKRAAGASVRLQAIDSSDKKIHVPKVKLSLVEHKFVSVLTKQDNSNYKYQSVRKDIPLGDTDAALPAEGLAYTLATDKAGDFSLVMKTPDGRELNHLDYSVIAEANLSRSLERNSELQVALNKKDFKPGEDIEMQIRAPYAGAGLITIERDEVYSVRWFKANSNNIVEHIKVPEGLEGNAYVNVTMLRAIDSKEVFTSPLSAAVAPFSISLDQFKTKVTLNTPDRVKPGQKLHIKYSADRRTPIILYGVDEGILQVAGYKLPNPLGFFFQKRSLQVRTYQLLDLLLPDYSILKGLSAAGGDEGGANGSNINPFRRKGQPPIAFWSGVIMAEPGTKTYTYDVPDYFNGNIRVMAVSAAQSGLGANMADALVRGDLIITPSAPTFASPGDEFQLGLSVSNQSDPSIASNDVKVELETSPGLTAEEKAQTVKIEKGHEVGLKFKVKATDRLGDGKITVKASVGGASAKYAVDMSVRPAVPFVSTLIAGDLSVPKEFKFDRSLYLEFAKQQLTVGSIPLVHAFALAQYLKSYPYECTEQLVSKGFPQLVLADRPEFEQTKKAAVTYQETIDVLRTRQTSSGAFALYDARGNNDDIAASLYAVHFLTEVKAHGHPIPEQMLERALGFLQGETVRQVESLPQARNFAYAIYLQARNGIVPTRDVGFLREALDKNFADIWKKDPAAIYLAGAYQLMKQEEQGAKLIRKINVGESTLRDYEYYMDSVVADSLLVYITAKHFPSLLKEKISVDKLKKMTAPLERGQFNTHSAAHVLMAFDSILSSSATFSLNLTAEEKMPDGKTRSLPVAKAALAKLNITPGALSVNVAGSAEGPLFYSLMQQGFDKTGYPEIKKQMEITRTYTDANGGKLSSVKLGQEVTVHLHTRATDGNIYPNVVLVDLLPSGFEVVLDSHKKGDGSGGGEGAEGAEGEGEPQAAMEGDEAPPEPPQESEGDEGWIPSLITKAYADEATASNLAPLYAEYVDYREDRVIIYAGLTGDVREFMYKIKAVNTGKFTVPPAFGESMYDRAVQYRGLPSTIEVTAP